MIKLIASSDAVYEEAGFKSNEEYQAWLAEQGKDNNGNQYSNDFIGDSVDMGRLVTKAS